MITLIKDTIDNKDVDNLIEWLKTYPRLTKGAKTLEFEQQFSEWIGTKHSIFVNSGSSANLLMVYALKYLGALTNNKIVVPSLSWATDLAPVIQLDIEPVLVDCNLDNLSVDLEHLEEVFKTENPDAMILVSVLGLSPDIDRIIELCGKYNVILIEDNCESQGSKYKGKRLGNFGLMSSFSTYFGHTMSTIERSMITTNSDEIYNLLLQLRSHGWDRDLPKEKQTQLRDRYNIDDFSAFYTFYTPGFNLRSTDLQAVIGIEQLKKVDWMIDQRNKNFKKYISKLKDYTWVPTEIEDSFTASFCMPIIANSPKQKQHMVKNLMDNNIECRPLICGSMGTQPFYTEIYGKKELPNVSQVDACGIYVPNHPLLTDEEIDLICKCIIDAL